MLDAWFVYNSFSHTKGLAGGTHSNLVFSLNHTVNYDDLLIQAVYFVAFYFPLHCVRPNLI